MVSDLCIEKYQLPGCGFAVVIRSWARLWATSPALFWDESPVSEQEVQYMFAEQLMRAAKALAIAIEVDLPAGLAERTASMHACDLDWAAKDKALRQVAAIVLKAKRDVRPKTCR